jgi:hypothetical protein
MIPSQNDLSIASTRPIWGLGRKIQKDRLTLALVVNMIGTKKLKLVTIYKYMRPRCFKRWLPIEYMWWFAKQMVDDIKCI